MHHVQTGKGLSCARDASHKADYTSARALCIADGVTQCLTGCIEIKSLSDN
jgi:hypothetical protein